jgi:hypothetical protein
MKLRLILFTLSIWLGSRGMDAMSDEGMFLLNEPPRERLKQKYQFDLTDEWLKQAQLSAIRMNNGGSASFLSPDGLLITNHHVGSDIVQKLSTPEKNYYRDGFYAPTREQELKCSDLEINVLIDIVDVTDRVNESVKPNMKPSEALVARRGRMSEIEKESLDQTKLRSDVVTLYQGGAYHLYRYKKYTDLRLVFAPEQAIASFGGDVDNFEFPRFNLDITFFRAYENGQPAKIERFLKFSPEGPKLNDLVFVVGNPGTTNRLETVDKLLHRRDFSHPYTLARVRTFEAALLQFSERGPNERLQTATDLHSYANRRKAFAGQFQGLLDPVILEQKRNAEAELLKLANRSVETGLVDTLQGALNRIRDVQAKLKKIEKEYSLLERGDAMPSELFGIARQIVRLTQETTKPSAERLREYRESNLESLKFQLFSSAVIHREVERTKLLTGITFLAEQCNEQHPLLAEYLKLILDGKSPVQRVDDLLSGTRLFDPAERRRLVEGGPKTIESSSDTMIVFARKLDEAARKIRQQYEEEVEEPERQAFADLARVRFTLLGRSVPPDATFTLRIAYGTVKGYTVEGKELPFHTTFQGLFERGEAQRFREPFDLPERWLKGRSKLEPSTPFNFVSTADTIGGNSGSPVLNLKGEFIGINFDRNRHGLVRNFVYTEEQARHIAVHSKGIWEALSKLYDCQPLLDELKGK